MSISQVSMQVGNNIPNLLPINNQQNKPQVNFGALLQNVMGGQNSIGVNTHMVANGRMQEYLPSLRSVMQESNIETKHGVINLNDSELREFLTSVKTTMQENGSTKQLPNFFQMSDAEISSIRERLESFISLREQIGAMGLMGNLFGSGGISDNLKMDLFMQALDSLSGFLSGDFMGEENEEDEGIFSLLGYPSEEKLFGSYGSAVTERNYSSLLDVSTGSSVRR